MAGPRLSRVILYVHDVERLSEFYRQAFAFPLVQHIPGEWAVLEAGACELALHRVGAAYRDRPPAGESNAKLVVTIDSPLAEMREALSRRGASMSEIKSYAGTGPLCDGRDPEGNVFQLAELTVSSAGNSRLE
jgi:predicted enzyme related to lactoylglutathione lyase